MAIIKTIRGYEPRFGNNCFLADNATVVGEVVMGDNCTVWFNAVVRGDVHSITIGDNTNIQDGAIVHCTYQKAKTVIGSNVSIAHSAVVHGCTVEDNVLIGMGAIVMDDAVIGSGRLRFRACSGIAAASGTRDGASTARCGAGARSIRWTG